MKLTAKELDKLTNEAKEKEERCKAANDYYNAIKWNITHWIYRDLLFDYDWED